MEKLLQPEGSLHLAAHAVPNVVDEKYDPNAIYIVERISYINIVAKNVSVAGKLEGIAKAPFEDICLSNVTITTTKSKNDPWNCNYIRGFSNAVSPQPCSLIQEKLVAGNALCPNPQKLDTTSLRPGWVIFPAGGLLHMCRGI